MTDHTPHERSDGDTSPAVGAAMKAQGGDAHGASVMGYAPPLDIDRRAELKGLLLMAGPNVAATAAETLMSFVDFVIVSRLGPSAMAAVQSGTMVFFTVFALMIGIIFCVSTTVSQSLGANRPRDCSLYAWQGVWMSVLYGGAALLLWPVIPLIFNAVGHAPDVVAMEVDYTRLRMLSLIPAGVCGALGHFFIGIHKPRVNTISVIVSTAVNAVLTYGLVLGRWGMPAMGIEGAALATVIATVVRVLWLMDAFCLRKVSAVYEATKTCRLDMDKLRRLMKIGWPAGMAFCLDIGAWSTFFVVVIGRLGTSELAASATCWRFTELSFMPAIGIGMAVSAMVGRAIGEGRPDLARYRTRLGLTLNLVYMGLMGALFVTMGGTMMTWFTNDGVVIALGASLMGFVAIFQLFDAVAITYSCALRGAGDTFWPAVAGAVLSWGLMVGGGMTISMVWPSLGIKGPWAFATLFLLSIGSALAWRWHGGRWETLDVIGRTEPQPAEYDGSVTEAVIAQPLVPPDSLEPEGPTLDPMPDSVSPVHVVPPTDEFQDVRP